MGALQIEGDVAVVAGQRSEARAAALGLRSRLPKARLRPMNAAQYLARLDRPIPLVLAGGGVDAAADRSFFERARDRILWPAPAAALYDAISGVLTSLPLLPRRPYSRRPRTTRPDPEEATGLLLEGSVGPERARAAIASPVRRWVVEHAGCVRMARVELDRLGREGVRWSALTPVRLVGVFDPARACRGVFAAGTPIWRTCDRISRRAGPSRARSRRPSPR